jgi:hypothetical protein
MVGARGRSSDLPRRFLGTTTILAIGCVWERRFAHGMVHHRYGAKA